MRDLIDLFVAADLPLLWRIFWYGALLMACSIVVGCLWAFVLWTVEEVSRRPVASFSVPPRRRDPLLFRDHVRRDLQASLQGQKVER